MGVAQLGRLSCDLPRVVVESEEAASVPSHAGDCAGDGGETAEDPPFPFEALGDDRDAMQDPSMLAHQHGSDANLRTGLRPTCTVIATFRTVGNATVLPGRRALVGESAGQDRAGVRAYVADLGNLFAPRQNTIHQGVRQSPGRMAADQRTPPAPDEIAVKVSSLGRVIKRLSMRRSRLRRAPLKRAGGLLLARHGLQPAATASAA